MSTKIEKLREIRDAIQSGGISLIPSDKLLKVPDDEAGFKAYYKKLFAPENFDRPEYHQMSVTELKDKLKEIRDLRAMAGLPVEADLDKTIDELWKRKNRENNIAEENVCSGISDDEMQDEIARLKKAINKSNLSDLHKMIMYLSKYDTWSGKHCLAPLSLEEFNKTFHICSLEPPEITESRLAEFNEIHRVEILYNTDALDNMTHEQIRSEIKQLISKINWK